MYGTRLTHMHAPAHARTYVGGFAHVFVVVRTETVNIRHRNVCAWSAAEVVYITDHAGLLLDDATAKHLQYAATLHVLSFAWLANATFGSYLYRPKPKWHYFEHLMEKCVRFKYNPQGWACWGEESFLAKVKCLGQKSHGKSMLLRSLQRYLLCLGMRWEARRRRGTWDLVASRLGSGRGCVAQKMIQP